jgi:glutamyl-tRNA reductase
VLIDIAQPRDVEDGADRIEGVRLFGIDDLRNISEENMRSRKNEAERAREFIDEELGAFIRLLNRQAGDDILAALYTWAEAIRVRERDRAIHRLGNGDGRIAEIMDDLTRVLMKKILADATVAIRTSAECGDLASAEAIARAITKGDKLCFRNDA